MGIIMALSEFLQVGLKKIFCVPLHAEPHEGVEELRNLQKKPEPTIKGEPKVSIATLMAQMAVNTASIIGRKSIIVLDAYFSVGPVFLIAKQLLDDNGARLLHVVTRAKSNVVAYTQPPMKKSGKPGRPRIYGDKLKLMDQFSVLDDCFRKVEIQIYNQRKKISFLCLDLVWKPVNEKVRFVLVRDGAAKFILISSDLNLSAVDILKCYSYRFKIEVNFKVIKHLIGGFYYHFWTTVWPSIGTGNVNDLSSINTPRSKRLIRQATDAIEAFMNFGCIATGVLQIISLNHHEAIWKKYLGWLRTVSSTIPSEEVVRSVIQEEYYHNFRSFSYSAIYRIIMAKSRKFVINQMPRAA